MSRFVMVSFFFMGWTFYELSGGRDFVPPERPEPIAVTTVKPIAKPQVTAASLVPKPLLQPVRHSILQPRINRTTAAQPDRPEANPGLPSQVALAQISTIGDVFEFGVRLGTAPSDEPTLQLASLAGGLAGGLAPLVAGALIPLDVAVPVDRPDPGVDLRHVTASRVNMRGGPGTIYPVIAQLHNDAAVEVLKDSGAGWLHLRVLEDDQTGWIAASLISQKRP